MLGSTVGWMGLACVVVALTACDGGSNANTDSTTPRPGATDTQAVVEQDDTPGDVDPVDDETDLPLEWIVADYPIQSQHVQRAIRTAIKPCMNTAGFDYEVGLEQDAAPYDIDARYRIRTVEEATQLGYTLPGARSPTGGTEAEFPSDPSERALYLEALEGAEGDRQTRDVIDPDGGVIATQVLTGGCAEQAIIAVFGSDDAYLSYLGEDYWIQRISIEFAQRTDGDPLVADATIRWSECMVERGYTFANPTEAIAAEWPEPRPTPAEIDTAVADANCKIDTGYREALVQAESRSQTAAVEASDAVQLAEIRERRDQIARQSIDIAGG